MMRSDVLVSRALAAAIHLVGIGYISFHFPALANAMGFWNAFLVMVVFVLGVTKVGAYIVARFLVFSYRKRG